MFLHRRWIRNKSIYNILGIVDHTRKGRQLHQTVLCHFTRDLQQCPYVCRDTKPATVVNVSVADICSGHTAYFWNICNPLLCNVPVPSPEAQPSLCTANTSYASPVQQLPQFQRWGLSWNYPAILQNMELFARCPPTPKSGYLLPSMSSVLIETPGLETFSDHSFFLSPVDLP